MSTSVATPLGTPLAGDHRGILFSTVWMHLPSYGLPFSGNAYRLCPRTRNESVCAVGSRPTNVLG